MTKKKKKDYRFLPFVQWSDRALIEEYQRLDDCLNVVDCFSVQDVVNHLAIAQQLVTRGYVFSSRLEIRKAVA